MVPEAGEPVWALRTPGTLGGEKRAFAEANALNWQSEKQLSVKSG
jgi:hypothetical protein